MGQNHTEMGKRENFSIKRHAILRALQETDSHPTADWVYTKLKPKYPKLSRGTVYRNLKRFCSEGKAVSVGVINGQEHFDATVENHSHLLCEKCGCISDLWESNHFTNEKLSRLSQMHECQINSAHVIFKGICKNCCSTLQELSA